MPDIFQSAVASDEYLAERVKPEVRDVIFSLQKSATPLTNLTRRLSSESSMNSKFQWLKDEIMPFTEELNDATSDTDLTITVKTSNKAFPIGTIILNVNTAEHMLVTGHSGATTINVSRGVGETAAASTHTNDGIYALGRAYKEDETLGSIIMTKVTVDYNYCQIFRTPFGGSGRDKVTGLFGGKNRAHQRLMEGLAHRRDIENAFLWGERSQTATSGGTKQRTVTRGVHTWMSTNTEDCSGTVTETLMDNIMRKVAKYDDVGGDRLLIASDLLIQAIGAFAKAKGRYDLSGAHSYYGVALVDYHTPFGMVHIAKASQTMVGDYTRAAGTEGYYAGMGLLIDMSDLKLRYMEGRNTNLLPNRQENGRDGWRDEYLSDVGLEVHFEQKHGYIYNFGHYSA